MSELEEKLGGILSNPDMMQQIMNMARTLGNAQEQKKTEEPKKSEPKQEPVPNLDMGMIRKLAGIMEQSGVDRNQLGLLKALEPYLSRDRITRLERAMHAARMAGAASLLMHSSPARQMGGR